MSRSGSPKSGGKGGGNTRPPSSKCWCFTLNNYSKYLKNGCDVLAKLLEESGLYVFQEELGEEGTPHLQGCVKFHKPCRPMERIKIGDGAIHWEKCRNWNRAVAYCQKEDTRNGGIWSNIEPEEDEEIEVDEPYGWQLDVLKKIEKKPHKRKIYWYWSEKGGVGKSSLCKYLAVKHNALIIGGRAVDMKCAIAGMTKKPKICILNVPKDREHVGYDGLEEVKDGCFFSSKYESGMVVMNNPHVIVFANFPPEEDRMSADRWKIKKIEDMI